MPKTETRLVADILGYLTNGLYDPHAVYMGMMLGIELAHHHPEWVQAMLTICEHLPSREGTALEMVKLCPIEVYDASQET